MHSIVTVLYKTIRGRVRQLLRSWTLRQTKLEHTGIRSPMKPLPFLEMELLLGRPYHKICSATFPRYQLRKLPFMKLSSPTPPQRRF